MEKNHSKQDNQPLLSIWCLSYNHKDFISEAIESFLVQKTVFKFEIIIHDDASNDGTQEIIKNYQNKYPDIIKVIYQQKNQYSQGINPINAIYAMTKSKFIAFCEGDDYWDDPHKLQTQVDFLINNPRYVATFHKSSAIDKEGNLIEEMPSHQCQDISAKDLQTIKRGMPSRTICMRNVINFDEPILHKYNRPDKILNGDTFMCSLLGGYGEAKFIDSIKPAVYRCWGGGSMVKSKHPIKTTHSSQKFLLYFSILFGDRKQALVRSFCDFFCQFIVFSSTFPLQFQTSSNQNLVPSHLQVR